MEKLDPACASGSEGAEASGLAAAAAAAAAFFLCRCWILVCLSRSCFFFRTRARFACWRRFVERGARGRGEGEAQPPNRCFAFAAACLPRVSTGRHVRCWTEPLGDKKGRTLV